MHETLATIITSRRSNRAWVAAWRSLSISSLRLVPCRLEVGYEPEVGHRSVQVYRRPCQTPSDIGLGGSRGGLPREAPEAAGKGVRALAMSDTTTRNDNAVPVSCVVRFRPEV